MVFPIEGAPTKTDPQLVQVDLCTPGTLFLPRKCHWPAPGFLSVLLQAWYDIEYLFTVGEGAFNPPPNVKSAVIRLVRNQRTDLGCDEGLFKTVVKTGFNQRRKTLRNSLKPIIRAKADRENWSEEQLAEFIADPVFELRPERLSVEDFISLTLKLA